MSCEDIKGLFPEFWDGKLDEADRLIVEAHLERCTPCRREAEQLQKVWAGLGDLAAEAAPSDKVRSRFYDRLEAYRMGAAEAGIRKPAGGAVVGFPLRKYWAPVGIAAALAMGFFSGYFIDARRDNGQLSQLRG
jgi:anti-sigma factor RsiW